jgi:hypothetical protein
MSIPIIATGWSRMPYWRDCTRWTPTAPRELSHHFIKHPQRGNPTPPKDEVSIITGTDLAVDGGVAQVRSCAAACDVHARR